MTGPQGMGPLISISSPLVEVTIDQKAGQIDPLPTSPVQFDIHFSEDVSGFADADVWLSGTAGATSVSISGLGADYVASVTGMTNTGTVIATIPSSVVTGDVSGLTNGPSTSTDNTVTWIEMGPVPSYVGTSGVVTGSTNIIADLELGDLVFRIGWPYGAPSNSDWTHVTGDGLALSYKFIDATDAAIGWTKAGQTLEVAFAFRNVGHIDGMIDANTIANVSALNNSNKTISGMTATHDNSLAVYCLMGFDDNSVTWTGATERFDVNTTVATDSTYSVATLSQPTAGSIASVTSDMSGTDDFIMWAVILRAAEL